MRVRNMMPPRTASSSESSQDAIAGTWRRTSDNAHARRARRTPGTIHSHGVSATAANAPRRAGMPSHRAATRVRTVMSLRETGCQVAPSISKGEVSMILGGVGGVIVLGRDAATPLGEESGRDEGAGGGERR